MCTRASWDGFGIFGRGALIPTPLEPVMDFEGRNRTYRGRRSIERRQDKPSAQPGPRHRPIVCGRFGDGAEKRTKRRRHRAPTFRVVHNTL